MINNMFVTLDYEGTTSNEENIYDYGYGRKSRNFNNWQDDFEPIEIDNVEPIVEEEFEMVLNEDSVKKGNKNKVKSNLFKDKKDKLFYGGFVRQQIYKSTNGRKELSISSKEELTNCSCCESSIHNNSDNVVYFKDTDSENYSLSDEILSLLQLYDFVYLCDCGCYNYGYIEENQEATNTVVVEECIVTNQEDIISTNSVVVPQVIDNSINTLKNKILELSERAKAINVKEVEKSDQMSIPISISSGTKKRNKNHTPNQMNIFDFIIGNQ